MTSLTRRSVLEIAKAVADRIGFAQPSNLTSTVDLNQRRFVRAIEDTVKDIAAVQPPSLVREYTFYTYSSVESYPLPGDFGGFVQDTQWNRAQTRPIYLVPAAVWQQNKSGIVASIVNQRFRIKGHTDGTGRFFIDPLPTSSEKLVFEYISNGYYRQQWNGAITSRHITISAANSGSPLQVRHATASVSIPGVFIVGANRGSGAGSSMEGNIFTVSSATVSNAFNKAWLQGTDGRDYEASGSMSYQPVANAVASASDIFMVDEELVEKGAEWRMRKFIGLPYAAEQMEFQDALDRYKGRKGGAGVVSLGGGTTNLLNTVNIPDGNYGL